MVSESTATDEASANAPAGRSPSCTNIATGLQTPTPSRPSPRRDGAQERTRTSTAIHHWYLKPARLPIPPPGPGPSDREAATYGAAPSGSTAAHVAGRGGI